MKAFHFRLDPVLEDRRRTEERRAAELAHARAAADEARRHREALESVLRSEEDALRREAGQTRRVGTVRNSLVVMEEIRARIQVAASKEAQAQAAVEERARAFRSAWEDRQALDRLRDRRREAWETEGARREQSDLDEAGRSVHYLARFRRGSA